MTTKRFLAVSTALGMWALAGCNRNAPPPIQAETTNTPTTTIAEAATLPEPAPVPAPTVAATPAPPVVAAPNAVPVVRPVTLQAGSAIPVRLNETLDTRRNRSGDHFTATLDEPLVSGDRVIVPKGTPFYGHITASNSSGRFKGRGTLALTLDSFELHGRRYDLRSTSSARLTGGHKKRNWLWMGGGSGSGAAIGAVAGGGVGALIGAGAGAAAGTVGAAVTGKRQVVLPVETRMTFKLRSSLAIPS